MDGCSNLLSRISKLVFDRSQLLMLGRIDPFFRHAADDGVHFGLQFPKQGLQTFFTRLDHGGGGTGLSHGEILSSF